MVELTSIGQAQAQKTGIKGAAPSNTKSVETQPNKVTQENDEDQVHFTGQARKINQILLQLEKQPVVDSKKVQAAAKAVSEGSFAVDPASIASKLTNFEYALNSISL